MPSDPRLLIPATRELLRHTRRGRGPRAAGDRGGAMSDGPTDHEVWAALMIWLYQEVGP